MDYSSKVSVSGQKLEVGMGDDVKILSKLLLLGRWIPTLSPHLVRISVHVVFLFFWPRLLVRPIVSIPEPTRIQQLRFLKGLQLCSQPSVSPGIPSNFRFWKNWVTNLNRFQNSILFFFFFWVGVGLQKLDFPSTILFDLSPWMNIPCNIHLSILSRNSGRKESFNGRLPFYVHSPWNFITKDGCRRTVHREKKRKDGVELQGPGHW